MLYAQLRALVPRSRVEGAVTFDATETSSIRSAIFIRSNGFCECGCGRRLPFTWEMDHWRGRREAQSVQNCWALTSACHFAKTNNSPSGIEWAEKFKAHAHRYGYADMEQAADTRIFVLKAKGFS